MAHPPKDPGPESTLPADEASPLERPSPVPRDLPLDGGGRYALGDEVARGGLGRVMRARDLRLDRPVAMKRLIDPSDERGQARFLREALVTARLQHPAIVPVYDAGRLPEGDPFYSMKLLSGRSLAEVMAEKTSVEARLAMLPVVITVAGAVAYAHSEGVIHRDLKPANVLCGPFGETVVIDWGLARVLDFPDEADALSSPFQVVASELTVAGTVLGTPAYMPPEQAEGKPVDVAADVYAVGAILYFVLSGAPPYSGEDSHQVLQSVLKGPPLPLGEREPRIPRDLCAIVDKAMARDPHARYPSAKELAQDLERFAAGQLVRAHDYSAPQRLMRFLRRHRAPLTLAALFSLALAGVGLESLRRIVRARNEALSRRDRLTLLQAQSALASDPTAALAWIDRYPIGAADEKLLPDLVGAALNRGVARHILRARDGQSINEAAFSPDGTLCATAEWIGTLHVWDVATGRLVASYRHDNDVLRVAFSPDGKWLASASNDRTVRLRRLGVPGGEERTLSGHRDSVTSLAFSPDGTRLATGSSDHTVRLWSLDGSSRVLGEHGASVTSVSFAPDGKSVASTGWDGVVRVWQIDAGTVQVFEGHHGRAGPLAFSPDGKRLASAGADGTVRIWQDPAPRVLGPFEGAVTSLAFSPDGKQLALGGHDEAVRLYPLDGGEPRVVTRVAGGVMTLAFSPQGGVLAAAGNDGVVRLCDLASDECAALAGHDGPVWKVAFSPNGRWLSSSGKDRCLRIWPVAASRGRVIHAADSLFHLDFSRDGRWLATDGRDGTALLLDLGTGELRHLRGHRASVFSVAFAPDSRSLVTGSFDHTVRVWDLASGESRALAGSDTEVQAAVFSPDGQRVAAATFDGSIHLWSLAGGAHAVLRGHLSRVFSVKFSPDGRWLASSSQDQTVRLWNLGSGESRVFTGHTAVAGRLNWAPDGKSFATAGFDGTARIWSLDGSSRRLDVGGRLWDVEYSPDGKLLATTSEDSRVQVWRLDGDFPPRIVPGHRGASRRVAFSPDGQTLASCGEDGAVRLFDLASGESRLLPAHQSMADSVDFSRDGAWLASVGEDKTLRLWQVAALPHVPSDPAALRALIERVTTARVGESDQVVTPHSE